ncbi:MAG: FAD:protein FMN transferase [Firmicutes bacterium]|nr:FAD:protein FMN transferase [Bacillota bacterium]
MKAKITLKIVFMVLLLLLTACSKTPKQEYGKYSKSFFDAFDTMTQVIAYTKSEEEFNKYYEQIHTRFLELHRLYDIYNNYPGINNIKTINDNAGIKPVEVEQEIIDLILFAKDWHERTAGRVNIAMGAVLSIWHDYRTKAIDFPEEAELPPMEKLKAAARHTDLDKVIVDTEKNTVYLTDKNMRLDVGAIAKGFATEIVVQEVKAAGLTSAIISAGGNIRTIGTPLDGVRAKWSIGIQDPNESIISENGVLETVFVSDASVVSSGDYQRYFIYDGKKYHHIIDPDTLMPGKYYRAVTVVTEDAGLADLMSTELFLLPFTESLALAEKIGVEALWVMPDGSVKTTEGLKAIMKSEGATNSLKK